MLKTWQDKIKYKKFPAIKPKKSRIKKQTNNCISNSTNILSHYENTGKLFVILNVIIR